jgi:hypothetical protein
MWECAAGRKFLSGRCAVTFIFADFDMAVAIIPGVDVRGSIFLSALACGKSGKSMLAALSPRDSADRSPSSEAVSRERE